MLRFFRISTYTAAWAIVLTSAVAHAQGTIAAFPSKPVRVIAPYAPGGAADVETRLYTDKMSVLTGQQFIVDYKPGAAGAVGGAFVAKATPDGYTLLSINGNFTTLPALYKNVPFDLIMDFAPVSQVSKRASVLVARPSLPANTFAEYIAYAKANPGKINFGTASAGGISHLAGALAHGQTQTQVTFIHYKGTGDLMPDMLAGRLDVTVAGIVAVLPLIKSGKLRALAITDDKRSKLLPEVPAIAEQGIPGYSVTTWQGLVVPAGTPPAIVSKLSATFATVAKSPEIVAWLEGNGSAAVGSTPAQFRQIIVSETERWKKVVKDAGIKLDE